MNWLTNPPFCWIARSIRPVFGGTSALPGLLQIELWWMTLVFYFLLTKGEKAYIITSSDVTSFFASSIRCFDWWLHFGDLFKATWNFGYETFGVGHSAVSTLDTGAIKERLKAPKTPCGSWRWDAKHVGHYLGSTPKYPTVSQQKWNLADLEFSTKQSTCIFVLNNKWVSKFLDLKKWMKLRALVLFFLHINLWCHKNWCWVCCVLNPRSRGDGKTSWKASTRNCGAHVFW